MGLLAKENYYSKWEQLIIFMLNEAVDKSLGKFSLTSPGWVLIIYAYAQLIEIAIAWIAIAEKFMGCCGPSRLSASSYVASGQSAVRNAFLYFGH